MQARRNELELKLIVPADFEMPPLEDPSKGVLTASEEAPLRLSATYFDTADLRLLEHGITLRYRTGDQDGPVWTLKLPATATTPCAASWSSPATRNSRPPRRLPFCSPF